MPLPAVLAWAASNPSVSIPIATTLASSLYRWINPDRARELQMDVLNSQTQFRDRLARQAFGDFTAAERQQIQAAAEPQVNQIASNVARRGLGGSGAGAQVIAQAQQAPFQQAQQAALQVLPRVDTALLRSSRFLMDDGSFFDDLGAIAQEFTAAQQAGDDTSELVEAIKMLYEATTGKPALTE